LVGRDAHENAFATPRDATETAFATPRDAHENAFAAISQIKERSSKNCKRQNLTTE
jgi:hypothetical protein